MLEHFSYTIAKLAHRIEQYWILYPQAIIMNYEDAEGREF